MDIKIDNQYRYGLVYNMDGQIVGFSLSPDVTVCFTDDDIFQALENLAKDKCAHDKLLNWWLNDK